MNISQRLGGYHSRERLVSVGLACVKIHPSARKPIKNEEKKTKKKISLWRVHKQTSQDSMYPVGHINGRPLEES